MTSPEIKLVEPLVSRKLKSEYFCSNNKILYQEGQTGYFLELCGVLGIIHHARMLQWSPG